MKKILIFLFFTTTIPFLSLASNSMETLIHARTGMDVLWQKNTTTRALTAQFVQTLITRPLTVSTAVQIALLNNRRLQATFEEIGIAQADLREAVTVPNPSIDFDVQFPATPDTINRYGWLIGQQFVQILMMPLKKKISEQALEVAELRVAAEVLELVAEVKKAYFTVQADQQLLSYLRAVQEMTAISLEFAQKQYKAGNITDLALLQYQAAYDEGRLKIADAESLCEGHREDLNILLGLWGKQTYWKIKGNLPSAYIENFSTQQLESLAINQRLDLQAAHYKVAAVASALGLTEVFRWLPILDFGFSGERDNDGTLNMGPQFRIELPIFNQGQFRVDRNQAELRQAVAKFEALAIQIRSHVRKFGNQLRVQTAKIKFYRTEIFPTQNQIINHSMTQYNAMQISPYELFLTKAQELKMQQEYISTLRDYWITRAELERIVGGTLNPPLSSPPTLLKIARKNDFLNSK